MDVLCVKWEHLLGAIIQKDSRVFQTGFNSSYLLYAKEPNNYELYIKEEQRMCLPTICCILGSLFTREVLKR